MFFRFAVILAMLSLNGACSLVPKDEAPIGEPSIEEREKRLSQIDPWRASGSIAIDSEADGKFHVSFSWDANADGFDIKLFGPLGVQAFNLIQDNDGARLIDRKEEINGDNAAELIVAALGVPVPINEMQIWAVGLPGTAEEFERDDFGRLKQLVHSDDDTDWTVDFESYMNVDEINLPRAVLISGLVNNDSVVIKLSFKKWSLELSEEAPATERLSIPGVDT